MARAREAGRGMRVVVLLCVAGLVSSPSPADAQGRTLVLAPRLDSLFAPYANARSAGCAVGVARDGRTLLERAYGMADLERAVPNDTATVFDAGSVSKQFTAAAIVILAERDSLSLDDDIRRWLPEVPALGSRPITIRDLLHHTSGLREWGVIAALRGWPVGTAAYTNAHVLDMMARQRQLNFEPGSEFQYSNTNYNLLAMVVQRVTDRTLAEYTRSAIFVPLHMTHTTWRDDYTRVIPGRALSYVRSPDAASASGVAGLRTSAPADDAYGSGGLLTTVGDLLVWNEELQSGRVLGRALGTEMERPAVLTSGRRVPYGDGLFLTSRAGLRQAWHAGSTGGYRSFLARLPERDISVAMLCNWSEANPFLIGRALVDVALGQSPTRSAPMADPAEAGTFRPMLIDPHSPFAGLYRDARSAQAVRFVPDSAPTYERRSAVITISSTEYRLTTNPGVRLVVRSVAGQRRPQLLWITPDADTTVLDPVEPHRPATPLSDYAGDWYSPEVEVAVRIAVEDGHLVALLRPDTRLVLAPIYADGFAGRGAVLRFDRNPAGQVTGLGVWAPRARDIRFERVLQ